MRSHLIALWSLALLVALGTPELARAQFRNRNVGAHAGVMPFEHGTWGTEALGSTEGGYLGISYMNSMGYNWWFVANGSFGDQSNR